MELIEVNNNFIKAWIPEKDYQQKLINNYMNDYPIFTKYINREKNILDIGACFGLMSLFFSKETNAEVLSFEPMEYNYKVLKKNTEKIDNIIIFNCGIGDSNSQNKSFNIYKKDENLGQSQLYQKGLNPEIDKQINNEEKYNSIKIESLDNIHIENCGFIKLDVEGFEYPALVGAKKFIKKHKPNIFVEIHSWIINEKEHNYKDEIFNLLKELNYKLDYTFSKGDEFIFIPE
jgi:FkbM family methyltransferase